MRCSIRHPLTLSIFLSMTRRTMISTSHSVQEQPPFPERLAVRGTLYNYIVTISHIIIDNALRCCIPQSQTLPPRLQ